VPTANIISDVLTKVKHEKCIGFLG